MKTYAYLTAVTFALVGATASVAHDPKGDVAQLQREVDDLRAEKNALQDQNIELARRFDTEKMRLQREKDDLLKQSALDKRQLALMQARLETMERQQGGAAPAPGSPLDEKTITVDFPGSSLRDIAGFVRDLTEVPVEVEGLSDVTVTLRGRALTLRTALDLIAMNARDEAGEWAEVEWSQGDDGVVRLRAR